MVGLNNIDSVGAIRLRRLLNHFGTAERAWSADLASLITGGIEENVANKIIFERDKLDLELLWEKILIEKIGLITIFDVDYPKLLKEIYNPPILLYLRGAFEPRDEFAVAVVGTRKVTSYGAQVAGDIARPLAKNGVTIISGLALGVDTLAHEAALDVGGRTIAVIGSGLDWRSIYPIENRFLAERIVDAGGMIISEFPLGMPPLKQNFPLRNRIISGLSLGTVVIEAGESSGALLTANIALEQNREVFAVPGSIYNRNAVGPNELIKKGAKLVSGAPDILESLNLNMAASFVEAQKISADSPEEEKILQFISKEPIHVDDLVRQTGLASPAVNATLVLMEMKGKVKNLGGQMYVIGR